MSEKGVEELKESKGGIKYELVLEQPTSEAPPTTRGSTSPSRQISAEEIENKLKAAEERRKSMEEKKLKQLQEKDNYISVIRDKRNEFVEKTVEKTRESLEKKMEVSKENRENYIKGIQDKSREHTKRVKSGETQAELQKFRNKLSTSAVAVEESRASKIAAIQDRLREHDKRLKELRRGMDRKFNSSGDDLGKALDISEECRIKIVKDLQDRMQEKRIAEVRQNKMSTSMTEESSQAAENTPTA